MEEKPKNEEVDQPDPYSTYTGNTARGATRASDNVFHMALLMEPEIESTHSAALPSDIAGRLEFDFEVETQ